MKELKGFQRSFLQKKAHSLSPVVMIGQNGLNDGVREALDKALEDHELIKVKFVDYKEDRRAMSAAMAEEAGAVLIRVIGNIAIIYRQSSDPEKQKIFIPGTHHGE